jgi:hypothetical protein
MTTDACRLMLADRQINPGDPIEHYRLGTWTFVEVTEAPSYKRETGRIKVTNDTGEELVTNPTSFGCRVEC